jgi:hypothetical protein
VSSPGRAPDLSFIVPPAAENRWSDLLAVLLTADPAPMAGLLGVEFDQVKRELTVRGSAARKADRLDLLLLRAETPTAAIEVKLLSDLGPRQLTRYLESFPGAQTYVVLHLERLPVTLRRAHPWRALTWEAVLDAYAASTNSWVATTAQAWRSQLNTLVPAVDATAVWNDVPDDASGMELALRIRVVWPAWRPSSEPDPPGAGARSTTGCPPRSPRAGTDVKPLECGFFQRDIAQFPVPRAVKGRDARTKARRLPGRRP